MPRIASPKIEYRPRKQVWVVTLRGRVIDECKRREGCEATMRAYLDAALMLAAGYRIRDLDNIDHDDLVKD